MRAITVGADGGPDDMSWVPVERPKPRAGEVLIEVSATAVNRADIRQRQGLYPVPDGVTDVLGLECSGLIAAVGKGVEGWHPGDRVCALLDGGGYAEYVTVPATQLLRVPAGLSDTEAAALPEVACTTWSNLTRQAGLRQGQVLLIHGGASGLGTLAIQYARALGSRVFTTVGTKAKAEQCRRLGAEPLVYRTEDFEERTLKLTEGRGADIILDCIGAPYLKRNLAALADEGRMLIIGLQGGSTADIDLSAVLRRRLTISGSTLRASRRETKAAIVTGTQEEVWPLVESGSVRPVIDRVLPIEKADVAHRAIEGSEHTGKVVLTVR